MTKLLWIAILAALVIGALSFLTRRPRDPSRARKLGVRALQKAPLDRIAAPRAPTDAASGASDERR